VQVTRGEPDGAGPDLTGTALLLSVLPAPRETGTPLADGPGDGRAGPRWSSADDELGLAGCETEPGHGWSRNAVS
jgi:hypothetical protein